MNIKMTELIDVLEFGGLRVGGGANNYLEVWALILERMNLVK